MEESWRGIKDGTHRTFLFLTAYGIPDLFLAAVNHEIPHSAKRDTSKETVMEMRKMLVTVATALPSFVGHHRQDCETIVSLYEGPPLPFNWELNAIKKLMGKGGGRSAEAGGASVASQQLQVAQQLGQAGASIGAFYMVRPTTVWSGMHHMHALNTTRTHAHKEEDMQALMMISIIGLL